MMLPSGLVISIVVMRLAESTETLCGTKRELSGLILTELRKRLIHLKIHKYEIRLLLWKSWYCYEFIIFLHVKRLTYWSISC